MFLFDVPEVVSIPAPVLAYPAAASISSWAVRGSAAVHMRRGRFLF